jgi:hypothetical protein
MSEEVHDAGPHSRSRPIDAILVFALCVAMSLSLATYSQAGLPGSTTMSFFEVTNSFTPIGGYDASSNEPPAVGQGVSFTGTLYTWNGGKRLCG